MRFARPAPRVRSVYCFAVFALSGLSWLEACKTHPVSTPQPAAERSGLPTGPRPTPAPRFRNIDSASFAQVRAYVGVLEFNNLASGTTRIAGTEIVWSPEIGSGGITDEGLASGRIIARARAAGTLASFGSRASAAYVWVDSGATGWRAIWLPADSLVPRSALPMRFGTRRFTGGQNTQLRVLADSFPNGRCGTRCCLTFPIGVTATPELVERLTNLLHQP
jgi:hypothetical protein